MKIKTRHISEKNFSPFGRLVTLPKIKPTSEAVDYRFWSDIANYAIDGETEIGICTVYKQRKALITGMERHMRTPEILIPIDGPFVLPLLLDGACEDEACAFAVDPGEAVVINIAVWHGACLPKGKKQSSYFVIFRRNTPHEDVQKTSVHPFEIIM
jgi:ureidoglycolate hydrolase